MKEHFDILNGILLPNENIKWIGKSIMRIFTSREIILILVSIGSFIGMLSGICIIISQFINPSWEGFISSIISIIFIIIGYYHAIGRFFKKKNDKKQMLNVITDKRVFIFDNKNNKIINSITIDNIPYITKNRVGKDGTGDLIFGKQGLYEYLYDNSGLDYLFIISKPMALYDVPEVETPYKILCDLKKTSN